MKKIFFAFVAMAGLLMVASCGETSGPGDGKCYIHGTVVGSQYEGKRIFLVPLYGPKTAEYVDSIEIKDGKFEFTTDSMKMFTILLDYHYRYGTQTLLVVGEPGNLQVTIDSISFAGGTPQNDSLQHWKEATEKYRADLKNLTMLKENLKRIGNLAQADSIDSKQKALTLSYKNYSRQMASNLPEGALRSFLEGMFPLTYKRTLPDGTVVTMDADTNEPVDD